MVMNVISQPPPNNDAINININGDTASNGSQ
jgi:hypothetical protein